MAKLALLFLAAGKSSRFGGEPKILSKIGSNGESLFELSILQIKQHITIKQIHMVLNEENYSIIMEEVINISKKYNLECKVTFNIQNIPSDRTKPWGTAEAAASAHEYITDQFLLLNSDDLYDTKTFQQINEKCKSNENYIIGFKLGNTLKNNNKANRGFITEKNGIVILNERLNIQREYFSNIILNQQYVSVNLFLLKPEILKMLYIQSLSFKQLHKMNTSIEAMLPDFINDLVNNKLMNLKLIKTDGEWNGVTYKSDVEEVKHLLK